MPWTTIALFLFGLLIIARGGGWFADGAVGLAAKTGIPRIIIGATIVSFATTLPEFSVSFMAALSDNTATAVGNAVGSTIANVGLILAIAVLIHPLQGARIDPTPGWIAVGALLLAFLLAWDGSVSRLDAAVLLAYLAIICWWQLRRFREAHQRKQRRVENEGAASSGGSELDDTAISAAEAQTLARTLFLFTAGVLAVILGSRLVVDHGVELARFIGVPELVIGLTIISIGTSLPELVTSITAALRRQTDLAVGNILGANLFNVAWVLPGAALLGPLTVDDQILQVDLPVGFIMALGVTLALMRGGSLHRLGALATLAVYGAYLIYLF